MTDRERLKISLNHRQPDKIPVDFGSTSVTGIHILIVEKLREYYGLEKKPVKVTKGLSVSLNLTRCWEW